jgi:hypothetical protein
MARKRNYRELVDEHKGIYCEDYAQEMCENDAISGAEEGFMQGYLNA